MKTEDACRIINDDIVTYPDLTLQARETIRFDDSIVLEIVTTPLFSQYPPRYQVRADEPVSSRFYIRVGDIESAEELLCRVVDCQTEFWCHEMREFTRLRPDYRAPVHPHTGEGSARWAEAHGTDARSDYLFGVAV